MGMMMKGKSAYHTKGYHNAEHIDMGMMMKGKSGPQTKGYHADIDMGMMMKGHPAKGYHHAEHSMGMMMKGNQATGYHNAEHGMGMMMKGKGYRMAEAQLLMGRLAQLLPLPAPAHQPAHQALIQQHILAGHYKGGTPSYHENFGDSSQWADWP